MEMSIAEKEARDERERLEIQEARNVFEDARKKFEISRNVMSVLKTKNLTKEEWAIEKENHFQIFLTMAECFHKLNDLKEKKDKRIDDEIKALGLDRLRIINSFGGQVTGEKKIV